MPGRRARPRRSAAATAAARPVAASLPVAQVMIDSPLPHLDHVFDYAVPADLDAAAVVGQPGARAVRRAPHRRLRRRPDRRGRACGRAEAARAGHRHRAGPDRPRPCASSARWPRGTPAPSATSCAPRCRRGTHGPRASRSSRRPGWPTPIPAARRAVGGLRQRCRAGAAAQRAAGHRHARGLVGRSRHLVGADAAALARCVLAQPVGRRHRRRARRRATSTAAWPSWPTPREAGALATLTADQGPERRYREFVRILRGGVRVVVGTRASVFAPLPDLRLIDRLGRRRRRPRRPAGAVLGRPRRRRPAVPPDRLRPRRGVAGPIGGDPAVVRERLGPLGGAVPRDARRPGAEGAGAVVRGCGPRRGRGGGAHPAPGLGGRASRAAVGCRPRAGGPPRVRAGARLPVLPRGGAGARAEGRCALAGGRRRPGVQLVRRDRRFVGLPGVRRPPAARRHRRSGAHRRGDRPGLPGRARGGEPCRAHGGAGARRAADRRRHAGCRAGVRPGVPCRADPRCPCAGPAALARRGRGRRAPVVRRRPARGPRGARHRDRRERAAGGAGARAVGRAVAGRPRAARAGGGRAAAGDPDGRPARRCRRTSPRSRGR